MLRKSHLLKEYKEKGKGMRLGQWYLNTYHPKLSYPELFYAEEKHQQLAMIEQMEKDYQGTFWAR